MESLTNIWSILLLFVLRLGVPLLITLALAYFLKRLDTRWQAEAREERRERDAVAAVQPVAVPKPVGQSPLQYVVALDSPDAMPCWMVKGCTSAMRTACAATHQPNVPCWQARTVAEGRLPAECKGCEVHIPAPYVMTEKRMLH